MSNPWDNIVPPKADKPAIVALKATLRGEATPDQQTRAIQYIVRTISAHQRTSFRPGPGSGEETAFNEGRRYVGNQIAILTDIPLSKLFKDDKK
jgi:hypothetical protein